MSQTVTYQAENFPPGNSPSTEFHRLTFLRAKNEIEVLVKASSHASIRLFDASKSSDASPYKVEVVLGTDGDSNASIELTKDDGKYEKVVVPKPGLLSATQFRAFVVRWANGRVMVYNDYDKKPFAVWSGPEDARFDSIGVCTTGCSGEWHIQGMPVVKTSDNSEYHEVLINSGRIDYEVRLAHGGETCVYLHTEQNCASSHYHYSMGYGGNKKHGLWFGSGGCGFELTESEPLLSTAAYKRFWIKWNAHTMMVGRGGSDTEFGCYQSATPFPQFNYFSLQSLHGVDGVPHYAFFRILDVVRGEDTAGKDEAAGYGCTLTVGYEYNKAG